MKYITVKQAAEKWGVSSTSIYRAAKAGRIPGAECVAGVLWQIPVDIENPMKRLTAPKPGYISVREAAEKWGVREEAVRDAAKEGRIPGAELDGGRWHIPEDAVRPVDGKVVRMPGYTSIAKTAKKWGVSYSVAFWDVSGGLVPGAEFIDGKWHVPEDAERPLKR